MQGTTKVNKIQLMEILKANREQHREEFLKAQELYREKAIEELDSQLDRARHGDIFDLRFVRLVQPQDHTDDYTRAIMQLEMSVDEEIALSEGDFAQLVQDQWGWRHQFDSTNETYGLSPKFSRSYDVIGRS